MYTVFHLTPALMASMKFLPWCTLCVIPYLVLRFPALLGSAALTAHSRRLSSALRRRCIVESSSWAPRGRPPGTAAALSASAVSSPPCPWYSSAAGGWQGADKALSLHIDMEGLIWIQLGWWRLGFLIKADICHVILVGVSLLNSSVLWSYTSKLDILLCHVSQWYLCSHYVIEWFNFHCIPITVRWNSVTNATRDALSHLM